MWIKTNNELFQFLELHHQPQGPKIFGPWRSTGYDGSRSIYTGVLYGSSAQYLHCASLCPWSSTMCPELYAGVDIWPCTSHQYHCGPDCWSDGLLMKSTGSHGGQHHSRKARGLERRKLLVGLLSCGTWRWSVGILTGIGNACKGQLPLAGKDSRLVGRKTWILCTDRWGLALALG